MVGCVIIAFVGSIYFLYQNFYLTLAGAQEVQSLVLNVSVVSFDPKKVEVAAAEIATKEALRPPLVTQDPFNQ